MDLYPLFMTNVLSLHLIVLISIILWIIVIVENSIRDSSSSFFSLHWFYCDSTFGE